MVQDAASYCKKLLGEMLPFRLSLTAAGKCSPGHSNRNIIEAFGQRAQQGRGTLIFQRPREESITKWQHPLSISSQGSSFLFAGEHFGRRPNSSLERARKKKAEFNALPLPLDFALLYPATNQPPFSGGDKSMKAPLEPWRGREEREVFASLFPSALTLSPPLPIPGYRSQKKPNNFRNGRRGGGGMR